MIFYVLKYSYITILKKVDHFDCNPLYIREILICFLILTSGVGV